MPQEQSYILLNAMRSTSPENGEETTGILLLGQDITQRKLIERELQNMVTEAKLFIDTANAPIFGIDRDGKVNEWNQMTEQITGYSYEAVLGQPLVTKFITPAFKGKVWDMLDKAMKGQPSSNFEFPLKTKSGPLVEILLNATTRRDAQGTILGVVCVGQA